MNTPSRKLAIGVVFIFIAGGVTYWLGSSSGTIPAKSVTGPSEKPIGDPAQNIRPSTVAAPKLPPVAVAAPKPLPVAVAATEAKAADQLSPEARSLLEELDQWVNSPPSNLSKGQIRGLIDTDIIALAHDDPAVALSKVGLIDDPRLRYDMTGEIYGWWLARDTPQGLAALAQLPDGQQTQDYYLKAFEIWAGGNADSAPLAAAAALGLPAGPDQVQALNGVATSWAMYDPKADLIWAARLPPVDTAALYTAVVAVSATDPNLAAQYVNQLADASAQSKAIQNISVNMAKTDPTATLAWLDKVATGETYDNSVAKLISTVAMKSPALATTLLAQVTKPGESDAVIASASSGYWARANPRAVAGWLRTLPESPARDAAIQKLVVQQPVSYSGINGN